MHEYFPGFGLKAWPRKDAVITDSQHYDTRMLPPY